MITTKDLTNIRHFLPPGYRKKFIRLTVSDWVDVRSYWDGGSKDSYALHQLGSGYCERSLNIDPWDRLPGDPSFTFVIPEGYYVTQAGTFCGKPATATLIFRSEDDLNKFVADHKLALEA